jgi:hypothetical protein
MAAGVGGLQTALILIGFIVRFQPNFNNNIEVYDDILSALMIRSPERCLDVTNTDELSLR